jgi:hypothetical protein
MREAVCGLAEEERRAGARTLEPEDDSHQGRLTAAIRARYGNELALAEREAHVLEHTLPRPIAECDVPQLDC